MQLRKATRKQVKLKIGIQGPSGSGKTFSALLVAFGMTGDWSKIAVIDAENSSSELYSHLGEFNVLPLEPPYTPERYVQAINACSIDDIEVVIIDSMSHEWDGKGGILEIMDGMTGNSFANWGKVTPRHNKFIDAILNTRKHFICTMRAKQDYVLTQNSNGKQVPQKVGLKAITREGVDYEFTLVFDVDIKHNANATKDRTMLFMDEPQTVLSAEHGKALMKWANSGEVVKHEGPNEEEVAAVKEHEENKIKLSKLLNNPNITDEEKAKMLSNMDSLSPERLLKAMDKLAATIKEREKMEVKTEDAQVVEERPGSTIQEDPITKEQKGILLKLLNAPEVKSEERTSAAEKMEGYSKPQAEKEIKHWMATIKDRKTKAA